MTQFETYPDPSTPPMSATRRLIAHRLILYENGSKNFLYNPLPQDEQLAPTEMLHTLVAHLDSTNTQGQRSGQPPFSEHGFTARYLSIRDTVVYTLNCQPHTSLDGQVHTSTTASVQETLVANRNRLLHIGVPTPIALGEASLDLIHLIERIYPSQEAATFENLPIPESSTNPRPSSASKMRKIWEGLTSKQYKEPTLR